ncbi:gustatory receptor for sugar taste 64a-like, partial [Lucilia sericata]|uniref:gustatory receptor for sugar taste 64a-like n=1 Tax=Lucilia sericata TaxID=13632 RepID=UPI0018A80AF2
MNNQVQNINVLNNKLNSDDEQSLSKPSAKRFYSVEEVEDVEFLSDNRYISDVDTNRTLTLRHNKTPVENVSVPEDSFSVIKPNKNYVVEENFNEEDEFEIKNSTEDTFHRAVSPILFLGQCFALMPVMGVLNPNPKRLKFSYKSLQVIFTIFFLCSSSILTLTMLKFLVKVGINAKNFVGLVFFSCVQCSTLLFASLAPRWPNIMRYWSRVETTFTQKPYEMPKKSLASRVRVSALLIIIGSA